MDDRREQLRVNAGLSVPIEDVGVRYETSGGAGGQHANRSHTRVELELDVRSCGGLNEAQRERIVARIGPIVRTGSADSRSQLRNREVALERLAAKLAAALHVDPPRRPPDPPAAR